MNYKIIAVDFDGTLCENKWPDIGAPNEPLIRYLIEQKKAGNKIILWTCRVGKELTKANWWCQSYGLYFDAINENLPEAIEMFGGDSRKIFAHEYIDDRMSKRFELPYVTPNETQIDICDRSLEEAIKGPSVIERITQEIVKDYDNLVLEAFANCGYDKEWLMDPDTRDRVMKYDVFGFDGYKTEIWTVDGVELFKIIHRFGGWTVEYLKKEE